MPESVGVAQSFTLRARPRRARAAPPAPPALDLDAELEAATAARTGRARSSCGASGSPRWLPAAARAKELSPSRASCSRSWRTPTAPSRRSSRRAPSSLVASPCSRRCSRGYELLGRWASAIEVTGALADLAPMPADRAALRYEQARMALDHLQDEERRREPARAGARGRSHEGRSARDAHPVALVAHAARAHARVPGSDHASAARRGVRGRHLGETAVAQGVVDEARAEPGDDLDPAPTRVPSPSTCARATTTPRSSALWPLEELGAADVDAQHAPRPVPLRRARARARHARRGGLVAASPVRHRTRCSRRSSRGGRGPACIARVEQLAARGRLVAARPRDAPRRERARRRSCAPSVGRARDGRARPELFAMPDVPGEIAAVRAPEPTTAVGPSVVSGRSAKDLGFPRRPAPHLLPTRAPGARVLPHARRAHAPAARGCRADQARRRADGRGRAQRGLAGEAPAAPLDDAETRTSCGTRCASSRCAGASSASGAWTRNVELMAARAGLLLSGDLSTAMAIVSNETRAIAGLPLEAKRRDLVAFCVSEEHVNLRARFAVAAPGSVRPPAPDAASPAA